MKIMTLQGTDKLLYELVAPLVMNPAILRQNNNYPFKTSRSHVWYIAFHETAVVGFMPVKKGHIYYSIDNFSTQHMSGTFFVRTLLHDVYAQQP
jgi:hypothetical protein